MNAPRQAADIAKHLKPDTSPALIVPKSLPIDPATQAVIDDLFVRLKGACPAWKQAWPGDEEEGASKREWLGAFMRAGIRSVSQIHHGLRVLASQRRTFVPAPGEFIDWCFSPEAFRLPSLEKAFSQALRNTHPAQSGFARWSDAAVYHAAVAAGYYTLQRLDRALGIKRFEEKYREQCRKLGRGETLPPMPVAALPEQAGPRTPEVAQAAIANLRGSLGGKRD